jgi:hypothetical protein
MSRVRVAFVVALLAFFGVGAGWALGLPVNGTYDEREHIVRAYGVASGQIYATHGTQRIPDSLLPGNAACTWHERKTAACQRPAPADHRLVTAKTGAAGYSPLYYLPVGLPMLISPDYAGIVAGRLVSALLAAVLLALAVAIAVRLRNRLLVGALVLVATPMVMNLAGSINPNGLEIAAGILLWTGLLALLRPDPDNPAPPDRRLLLLTTTTAVLLMTLRHMGPVLLGIVLIAAALLARPGRVRELARRRDVRRAAVIVVLAGLVEVFWILTSGVTDVTAVPSLVHDYGPVKTMAMIVYLRIPFYVRQVIGQFSFGETTMPEWAYTGWYIAIAAFVVPPLVMAGRRYRLSMVGLLLACFAVLAGLEYAFLHTTGWVAHSRYVLPAAAGLVLGAAFVRRWRDALGPAATERLILLAVAITIPIHLWALCQVIARFRIDPQSGPNPFKGDWSPAGDAIPAVGAALAGTAALAVLACVVTRRAMARR